MTDYAPGPWHAHKTGIVTFYGTRRIQVATTRQPLFTAECQEANARLIAAAPDMLAALWDIVDAEEHDGDASVCDFQTLQSIARAAITRATRD